MRKKIAILAFLALLLTACSAPVHRPAAIADEIGHLYAHASEVIVGRVVSAEADVSGFSRVEVQQNLAGVKKPGETLYIKLAPGTQPQRDYVFFLTQTGEAVFAEDPSGYTPLSGGQLSLEDGRLAPGGLNLPFDAFQKQLETAAGIVSAPSGFYYYGALSKLAFESDHILLARLVRIDGKSDVKYQSSDRGFNEQYQQDSQFLTLDALNVVQGALLPRTLLTVAYSESMLSRTVNAATLKNVPFDPMDAPPLELGRVYLFFLNNAEDQKQDIKFLANPLQGMIAVQGDRFDLTPLQKQIVANSDIQATVNELVYRISIQGAQSDYKPFVLQED